MKIGYYPQSHVRNNVVYFLEKHAALQPNKVAFRYLSTQARVSKNGVHSTMTYADFNTNASQVAGGFSCVGITRGDRVLVFVPISPELYVAIAALQRIGAIPVLLDSWTRQEQLGAIAENAKPCAVIAPHAWLHAYTDTLHALGMRTTIASDEVAVGTKSISATLPSLSHSEVRAITPVEQDDTALITYTTGSSGVPKGVNRTHRFLAAQHYALKRLFPYEADDIDLPVFPVFALNNIASGITTVIPAIDISRPNAQDPKVLLTQIKACNVTCMTLAPSSFRNLAAYCDTKHIRLSGVKRVLTGGAPISETEIARFIKIAPRSKNWILYGSTEVEPIAFIESRTMLGVVPPQWENTTKIGVNVGTVDTALRYKLIHIEYGTGAKRQEIQKLEVARGAVGELVVSGEHVCKGYFRNKAAFTRTKIQDTSGRIWHRTGDLARVDQEGYLWIVGRKHNIVQRNDKYYFPVRPEIMLKDIEHVSNAAYVGTDEGRIVAVVTLTTQNERLKKACIRKIVATFKAEQIPLDAVLCMAQIPMDVRHHSKVDYDTLRKKLHELHA